MTMTRETSKNGRHRAGREPGDDRGEGLGQGREVRGAGSAPGSAPTAERTGRSDAPVVLVTGAGSGLGAATARVLADAGYRVVAADIDLERARETAHGIDGPDGDVVPLELDVTDIESAQAAIAWTVDRFSSLDVLINNAGIDVTLPFEQMGTAEWNRVLDVNLRGPMLMSQLAFPALRMSGRGHIVNIASTAAKRAWENATAYHASKWGLLGFSHALHTEARAVGIKVTAIVTGGMRTPFLLDRFPDLDLGVLQPPENVARAILFALRQPDETVIPEMLVLPMRESSWP